MEEQRPYNAIPGETQDNAQNDMAAQPPVYGNVQEAYSSDNEPVLGDSTAPAVKKKSRLPLILGIVAGVIILLVAAFFILKGKGASIPTALSNTAKEFENSIFTKIDSESGVYEALVANRGNMTTESELEITDFSGSSGNEASALLNGAKISMSSNFSESEKKASADMEVSLGGLLTVGAEFYADDKVLQLAIPMLSNDVLQINNDDILGQLGDVIPEFGELGLEGGKISFDSKYLEKMVERFMSKYNSKLIEAGSKITVEKQANQKRDALGKTDVDCETYKITIPAETQKQYAECISDFVLTDESFEFVINMLIVSESLTKEELKDDINDMLAELTGYKDVSFDIYLASKGLFDGSCIVGLRSEYEGNVMDLAFKGEKNIFDDVALKIIPVNDSEVTLNAVNTSSGSIISYNMKIAFIDVLSMEYNTSYDKSNGNFSMKFALDYPSMSYDLETSAKLIVKDKEISFKDMACEMTTEIEGEESVIAFEGEVSIGRFNGSEAPSDAAVDIHDFDFDSLGEGLFGGIMGSGDSGTVSF